MKVQKLGYREYWGYYWRVESRQRIPGISAWDENLVDLVISRCRPPAGGRILDLGCAGGDQAKLFARKGYDITGVDQVDDLIGFARQTFLREGLKGTFLVRDMRTIEYRDEFDLCVMLSGTFAFSKEGDDRLLLGKIHESLKPGGHAFIDYLPVETYAAKPRAKTWHELEGGYALTEEWFHVPTSTWRTRHVHIFLDGRLIEAADGDDYGANEVLRCYTATEIERLARSAGFGIDAHLCRQHVGDKDYQPGDDEPRGIVVLVRDA